MTPHAVRNPHSPIRAVTFDVGGTLIQPWPSVGHVYSEIARRHGHPPIPPETLEHRFSQAWSRKADFQHRRDDWALLVDDTFEGLLPRPPSRTFFPALYERFAKPDVWRIFDDVLPVLDALASHGFPLAIVSNWDERLRPLLKALRLDSYFETIVVSCEVAFPKPSPVIFEFTAQKLGLPPQQILHVGDHAAEDFDGATSAGFHARILNRSTPAAPPHQLDSLVAVLRLLDAA